VISKNKAQLILDALPNDYDCEKDLNTIIKILEKADMLKSLAKEFVVDTIR
jgi:hypothetical protein